MTLLGGAVASWPLAAPAQQTGTPVIGVLGLGPRPNSVFVDGFRQGLAEAGYVPGQNVSIEFRWADNPLSLPRHAAELVDRKVDVIVTTGSPYAAVAAKHATLTIPIVFGLSEDPRKYGLVTSLSRPGGNVTGITFLTSELVGKWLNLLLDLIPQPSTIAYLSFPDAPVAEDHKRDMLAAGRALGREIIVSEVRRFDFGATFTTLVEQRADALVVGSFTVFAQNRKKIVELAARDQVPAIYPSAQYVIDGGLMSYGTGSSGVRELARNYVGQILKGTKPADLPVQRPSKFEFVINLKTATAMGLTIPRTLFATATEWIE